MGCTTTEGPPVYPLPIPQGVDWSATFPVFDDDGNQVDPTGWAVKSQIRTSHNSPLLFEWSDAQNNVETSAAGVKLILTPADSSPWTFRTAMYDIVVTDPDGKDSRISQGPVFVSQSVTQI